jgi:acetyl esterase/lipase
VSVIVAGGVRPAALTARLREIGARWQQDIRAASDETKSLYAPLLASSPREGVRVTRDIAYGTHARQVLDVYAPFAADRAPVIAFLHGGAFVRGAKDINDVMYGNVLTWFARHGCVGVNIEYRLAPGARFPAGAIDAGLACRWIEAHIAGFGGDAARIALVGHSAGGTHAASLACDPLEAVRALQPAGLCCLVLISARLRVDALPENPNADGVRAYFGDDADRFAACSPVTHAARLRLPLLVVNAQYENPLLDLYGLEFALAVGRARQAAPLHVAVADHNHMSIVAHFNTPEQALGEAILAFVERA